MTDLDTGPSSIRDDSICESSLHPNKSSGDIVERLRERRGVLDNRWPGPTTMDLEAAAEIERLRREVEEANRFWNERCVQTSVNAHGWMQAHDQLLGFIQSRPDLLKVMMAEKFEIKYPAPADTPTLLQRALTAESAVAGAWEEAADWLAAQYPDNVNTNAFCAALRSHVRPSVFAHSREDIAVMPEGIEQAIQLRTASEIEQERRASAIRAAGEKKTAEV